MSRSKPIWNVVRSCRYNSDKSWGGYDDVRMETRTGSSGSNSHHLATLDVKRKFYDNFVVFNYKVEDKLLFQNIHHRNGDRAGDLISRRQRNFMNSSNQHTHPLNKKL